MFLKSHLYLAAALALALPAVGFSAAIEANTNCESASCSAAALTAAAITPGGNSVGSFNFDVTVGTDMYKVTGTYFDTLSTTDRVFIGFFPTVTLISGVATSADSITLDLLQDFSDPNLTKWDGSYNENIPLVLPVAGSTGQGQISYDGQSVGLLGPVSGTGVYNLSATKNPLTPLTGSLLSADFMLTFTFPKGTPDGGFASSPSPEPAEAYSMAIGLGLLGLAFFRNARAKR
jgi:hypothetical protein